MVPKLEPAVGVSTALALALLALGGCSLAASVMMLPHEPVLEAMRNQASAVRPREAEAAMRAAVRAAEWSNGCRYLTEAALASDYAQRPERETGRYAEAALARCPVSPHNWLRLTLSREGSGDAEGARAAWRLSVLTGPYVPRLQQTRLEIGLGLLTGSDAEYLDLLAAQVRQTAALDPGALARVAARTGTLPLVRLMLRSTPRELEAFEKAVAV